MLHKDDVNQFHTSIDSDDQSLKLHRWYLHTLSESNSILGHAQQLPAGCQHFRGVRLVFCMFSNSQSSALNLLASISLPPLEEQLYQHKKGDYESPVVHKGTTRASTWWLSEPPSAPGVKSNTKPSSHHVQRPFTKSNSTTQFCHLHTLTLTFCNSFISLISVCEVRNVWCVDTQQELYMHPHSCSDFPATTLQLCKQSAKAKFKEGVWSFSIFQTWRKVAIRDVHGKCADFKLLHTHMLWESMNPSVNWSKQSVMTGSGHDLFS